MANEAVLTPQGKDFPQWYQDVVARAELAENGPARGSMVIRPWAWATWELMQADMDRRLAIRHQPIYDVLRMTTLQARLYGFFRSIHG